MPETGRAEVELALAPQTVPRAVSISSTPPAALRQAYGPYPTYQQHAEAHQDYLREFGMLSTQTLVDNARAEAVWPPSTAASSAAPCGPLTPYGSATWLPATAPSAPARQAWAAPGLPIASRGGAASTPGSLSLVGLAIAPMPVDAGSQQQNSDHSEDFPWWPAEPATRYYHGTTRLPDGEMGLLVDPGAHGNLCGEEWARDMIKYARLNGYDVDRAKLANPLEVHGVGSRPQPCTEEVRFPIATMEASEIGWNKATLNSYQAPVIPGSGVPALLGLASLKANRAILDCGAGKLHLCGPGAQELNLPAGTRSYDLRMTPSGHWLLPCSCFGQLPERRAGEPASSRLQPRSEPLSSPTVSSTPCESPSSP